MDRDRPWTISKGELLKFNLEGCRHCGRVYVSSGNAGPLGVGSGWHDLADLQQKKPGDRGMDVVLRVRGRVWGGTPGKRICPNCKAK